MPAPGDGRAPRIVLAAGGTGGHLFPALALARALKAERPRAEVLFIGAGRPVEREILEPEGWPLVTLKSSGWKGQGLAGRARALGLAVTATFEARRILAEFRPDLCFGAGGYVSGPVGLAARLAGRPLVIHEANSRPGLSNRLLGRLARVVMLGFPEAAPAFEARKIMVTGNPVRPEIEALHGRALDFGPGRPTVLVTGGSQGASALNQAAVEAFAALKAVGLECEVIHQSGPREAESLAERYRALGLAAETAPFFRNMPELYGRARLIICRGGAGTVSEVAAAGLPSIIVPLPTAADDHQTVNARRLTDKGAAVLLPQRDLSAGRLAAAIKELLEAPERLKSMSRAARETAFPGADRAMARRCLEIIEETNRHVS